MLKSSQRTAGIFGCRVVRLCAMKLFTNNFLIRDVKFSVWYGFHYCFGVKLFYTFNGQETFPLISISAFWTIYLFYFGATPSQ